jgi:O-antigen ligase
LNTQLFGRLCQRLEPALVVLLLIGANDLDCPSYIRGGIKLASYASLPFLIMGQRNRFAYVVTRDIPLLILLGTAVLSVFWSVAPDSTIEESKALVRATLFGAYLATRYTPKEQMQLLTWVIGLSAFPSLVVGVALPSYGTQIVNHVTAWKGIFTFKQYLARTMTIGSMVLLLTILDSRKYRWVMLAMLSVTVVLNLLSTSKTGLGVFVLSICSLPLYKVVKQKNYKQQTFLLIIVLILSTGIAVLILSNREFIVVDVMGKDLELNGRSEVWTLAIQKGLEQPWLGYGYAGFWSSEASDFVLLNSWAELRSSGTRMHAHSGYIDLFLQLGWLGILLFMVSLLIVFIKIFSLLYLTKKIEYFWMLQMILIILFFNYTELITFLTPSIWWIYYVSISLSTAVELRRIKREKLKIKQDEVYEIC